MLHNDVQEKKKERDEGNNTNQTEEGISTSRVGLEGICRTEGREEGSKLRKRLFRTRSNLSATSQSS